MKGTTPPGITSEDEASRWVRRMFGQVAPNYDLANHVLSMNVDRYWRSRTVRRVRSVLKRPDARVLDICCGTGDLMLALEAERGAPVYGSDFCHPMLTAAAEKAARQRQRSPVFESDALQLPVRDASLDLITVAFGFRNLANYQGGLREMLRVLRPGGVAAILEFSTPPNPLFRSVYNFYSSRVLPVIGGMLSGTREAYTYLPESVKKFPNGPELVRQMEQCGFRNVRFEHMTFGIVALHLGERP